MNEAHGDTEMRTVQDADNRVWHVYVVQEGMRWDPEIEMRRRNWLCCAALDERRFISPVPPNWERWSDVELLAAIAGAKADHRGPS
jgi:hypothetical protein